MAKVDTIAQAGTVGVSNLEAKLIRQHPDYPAWWEVGDGTAEAWAKIDAVCNGGNLAPPSAGTFVKMTGSFNILSYTFWPRTPPTVYQGISDFKQSRLDRGSIWGNISEDGFGMLLLVSISAQPLPRVEIGFMKDIYQLIKARANPNSPLRILIARHLHTIDWEQAVFKIFGEDDAVAQLMVKVYKDVTSEDCVVNEAREFLSGHPWVRQLFFGLTDHGSEEGFQLSRNLILGQEAVLKIAKMVLESFLHLDICRGASFREIFTNANIPALYVQATSYSLMEESADYPTPLWGEGTEALFEYLRSNGVGSVERIASNIELSRIWDMWELSPSADLVDQFLAWLYKEFYFTPSHEAVAQLKDLDGASGEENNGAAFGRAIRELAEMRTKVHFTAGLPVWVTKCLANPPEPITMRGGNQRKIAGWKRTGTKSVADMITRVRQDMLAKRPTVKDDPKATEEEKIEKLVGLGFDIKAARKALKQADGSASAASDTLNKGDVNLNEAEGEVYLVILGWALRSDFFKDGDQYSLRWAAVTIDRSAYRKDFMRAFGRMGR